MTTSTVHLGHINAPSNRPRVPDLRGRLLHLAGQDVIVVVQHRVPETGWWCSVIARRHPSAGPSQLLVTDAQAPRALTSVTVDRADCDAAAMVWLAQVWQRWRGGLVYLGARALAEEFRTAGTLSVDVDLTTLRRLASITRLRLPGLGQLLRRLREDGFLTRVDADGSLWGRHVLTVAYGRAEDGSGIDDDGRWQG
jgi:hypothetical protein